MVNERDFSFQRAYITVEGDRSQTRMQTDHLLMVPERELTGMPSGLQVGQLDGCWCRSPRQGVLREDQTCLGRAWVQFWTCYLKCLQDEQVGLK